MTETTCQNCRMLSQIGNVCVFMVKQVNQGLTSLGLMQRVRYSGAQHYATLEQGRHVLWRHVLSGFDSCQKNGPCLTALCQVWNLMQSVEVLFRIFWLGPLAPVKAALH
ncbi:hypothetical protein GOODEAATRI_017349 [Goodea atripinnis]|uniref:Uncharacterized protein n=1 Tax=Goodea atripinnis TaxID=208336 RepID=A0ABV0PZC8_9TELE